MDKQAFRGLRGEVVFEDTYRLQKINDYPDLIFDLGANVGVFTRWARFLFPEAVIVSVEPDDANFAELEATTVRDDRMFWYHAAIGKGPIWRCPSALNGAHECYLAGSSGFPTASYLESGRTHVSTQGIMPCELWKTHGNPDLKTFWKIDCEGGENAILDDPSSREVIANAKRMAMEMHYYGATAELSRSMRMKTFEWIAELSIDHKISCDNTVVHAEKR